MRKTLGILIVSLLFSGCVSMKTYRETKSELLAMKYGQSGQIDVLRADNDHLKDENARLQALLHNANNDTRVAELESALAERNRILDKLRSELTSAVGHLRGKGLSLESKNGKIYVLMEDKLLFESGKYDLTREGEKAIRDIGTVLARLSNVDILIEGHTDNKQLKTRKDAEIIDNWDLSCKRATEVVRIINSTQGLNPKRITAAGRSYYSPVATNNTDGGRAQNRRTEIILTPQLDKLIELLK